MRIKIFSFFLAIALGLSSTFSVGASTQTINAKMQDVNSLSASLTTPPGAGIYDDTNAAWIYSSNWITETAANAYQGDNHLSNGLKDSASFTFNGRRIILIYGTDPGYGTLTVFVNGTKVGTVNEYNSTPGWQKTWTSPKFAAGTHTVKFIHASGASANIDAIQIIADVTPPAAITTLAAKTGATGGNINLTWKAPGDDGNIGTASTYLVRYSNAAITTASAWNAATPVTVGVPAPAIAGTVQSMIVSGLKPNTKYYFSVRAEDEVPNLDGLSNSPAAVASAPITSSQGNVYYVSTTGSDTNPGTLAQPWKTIQKATQTIHAGDTIYLRSGTYQTVYGGWNFQNTGTANAPITLTNYPGEQAVIHLSQSNYSYMAFYCWHTTTDPASWQKPKADYIHIVGTDVVPRTLSNGVQSRKGLVIQGDVGEQALGIVAAGCDSWEVAGVDFVAVADAIFTKNRDAQTMDDNSADNWYVHNNRVYNYYRESGMQFNGNNNTIVNNEIYKVSNDLDTPYGCQLLNLLGHGDVVRGNTLSRLGSTATCGGILFEWDMSDKNLIERNLIKDVSWGITFAGGDNNIVRNNLIYTASGDKGISITSYDNRTSWPCDETTEASVIMPANNPADPNYQYYYNPRNCHSYGNQVYNNTIYGFSFGIAMSDVVGENTIIRNNAIGNWSWGGLCLIPSTGNCQPFPNTVTADHNATQAPFGFADTANGNFHLLSSSPLIDAGYPLGTLNPNDYDGIVRPQGNGYDIGAYEFQSP